MIEKGAFQDACICPKKYKQIIMSFNFPCTYKKSVYSKKRDGKVKSSSYQARKS